MKTDTKDGTWALWLHIVHMAVIFCSIAVTLVFGRCFDLDKISDFSIMYRDNGYTVVANLYRGCIIISFSMIFMGTFHTFPYLIIYWIRRLRNRIILSGTTTRGILTTLLVIILVAFCPFWVIHDASVHTEPGIYTLRKTFEFVAYVVMIVAVKPLA